MTMRWNWACLSHNPNLMQCHIEVSEASSHLDIKFQEAEAMGDIEGICRGCRAELSKV